jgi:hypothetical protein
MVSRDFSDEPTTPIPPETMGQLVGAYVELEDYGAVPSEPLPELPSGAIVVAVDEWEDAPTNPCWRLPEAEVQHTRPTVRVMTIVTEGE